MKPQSKTEYVEFPAGGVDTNATGDGRIGDPLPVRVAMILLDTFIVLGIYLGSLILRYPETYSNYLFSNVIVIIALSTLVPLSLIGGYSKSTDLISLRFMSEHIIVSTFSFLVASFCIYVASSFNAELSPARLNVSLTLILFPFVSLIYRRQIGARISNVQKSRSLFILGVGPVAQDFYRLLKNNKWPHSLRFFQIAPESGNNPHILPDDSDSPLVEENLEEVLAKDPASVESIVLAEDTSNIPVNLLRKLVSVHFSRIPVQTLDTFFARQWKMVPTGHVSLAWAFEKGFRLNSPSYERVKRLSDIILSSLILLIFLPVLLFVPILIRWESPGPALFRQTRVGHHRKPFVLLKFRTMRQGSEKEDIYTRGNDSRITRLGAFLRKVRLLTLIFASAT